MENINLQILVKRPLSLISGVLALLLILHEVIQIASGELYQRSLHFVDGTTLIELGFLALLGLFTLRDQSDLQAVSSILVAGLSFIFIYEAIYKWSFYLTPFRLHIHMPPEEFREFVIQVGIAATILTCFASGCFTLKKWTFIWLGLFILLYVFWMLIGFPQVTGEVMYHKIISINLTHWMTYTLNRGTKLMMYLAYLTLFPPLKKI